MNTTTKSRAEQCPSYDELVSIVAKLQAENQWLKEQFNLLRANTFGASQESLTQISLLDDGAGHEAAAIEEENISGYTRKKRKPKKGRTIDTSTLPRETIEHGLSDAEKTCSCQHLMTRIGKETSEKIDFIPPRIKVIEHIEYKYACRQCGCLKQAKKPEQPLGKLLATVPFLVEIILKKFQHHPPYYRQSKILAQSGIAIADNTLANWVMKGGKVLHSLYEALTEELKKIRKLQVDESPIRVLSQDAKGYVWCYYSYDKSNEFFLYEIAQHRSADVVNNTLAGYEGILQSDGYSGYNRFRKNLQVMTPGCWAHARRKFFDVLKSKSAGYATAAKFIRLIDQLFEIESQSKQQTSKTRLELRAEHSAAIIEKIKVMADDYLAGPLPKSSMGKALTYLVNQWDYLILFLQHEDIELSTNWVENAIRPLALGRKNWLFINSLETGQTTALFYSLIQTCVANHIKPRDYLTYVFNCAPQIRRKEICARSLLPQFIDREKIKVDRK